MTWPAGPGGARARQVIDDVEPAPIEGSDDGRAKSRPDRTVYGVDGVPPTQLRLGIDPPRGRVSVALSLGGLTVTGEVRSGSPTDGRRYLAEAGIDVRSHSSGLLAFPVAQLGRLRDLDERCEVHATAGLGCLVQLARRREPSTATVDIDAAGELHLRFWDGGAMRDHVLDDVTAQALCCADLPFVASSAAWEHLEVHAAVPHTIGRASVSHDGYVEIWASRPQLVEGAPVPGLFRIAPDRFGVAAPHAHHLDEVRGIVWSGSPPRPATPDPGVMGNLSAPLAPPTRRLCARLVDRVASWGAALLVAGGGRARRTVAASTLEVLEAWPALIVCPPWALWSWWRTITLVGRELGIRRDARADARVVTWMDLAHGAPLDPVAAVILDDLCGPDAARAVADGAVARLGALADAARIGVSDTWPEDPEEACRLANCVRPGEFDLGDRPLAWRYPLRPGVRAAEHLRAWMVTPTATETVDAGTIGQFRHSQVRLAHLDRAQRAELDALARSEGPDTLTHAVEVISSGGPTGTSAKVALCLEEVQRSHADGAGPVAVWVTSRRAAVLLRAMLAGRQVRICEPDAADGLLRSAADDAVVIVCGPTPGDLRAAATVVVETLAVSFATLDDAVGASYLDAGPRRVVVLHSPNSPDDRIATWAAAGGTLAEAAADPERRRWLLAPRWVPAPIEVPSPAPTTPRPPRRAARISSAPHIPGAT